MDDVLRCSAGNVHPRDFDRVSSRLTDDGSAVWVRFAWIPGSFPFALMLAVSSDLIPNIAMILIIKRESDI